MNPFEKSLMPNDNQNKILYVKLHRKQFKEAIIAPEVRKDYIGGAGINAKILYANVGPRIEPLAPENLLIFGAGCLVGTGFLASARLTVTAKSPLTGIFADSNAGGHFAPNMRAVGYDHLVFEGEAAEPVYVLLSPDEPPPNTGCRWVMGVRHAKNKRFLKG